MSVNETHNERIALLDEIKMKSLIIGKGEVGKSLYKVLKPHYETYIRDKENLEIKDIEVLHICFPYFEGFEKAVEEYKEQYNPKYTIIHSTVPVGTSRKCSAYHSSVRGMHPDLSLGLLTLVKYLAPKNETLKEYFEKAKMKVEMFDKPETTELGKILSTTYYAWNIIFCKEVKRICDKYNLDFNEVYTRQNQTYNEGYTKMGMSNVNRSILKPVKGQIGGHCVIQNCHLLEDKITKLILEFNKDYEKPKLKTRCPNK